MYLLIVTAVSQGKGEPLQGRKVTQMLKYVTLITYPNNNITSYPCTNSVVFPFFYTGKWYR